MSAILIFLPMVIVMAIYASLIRLAAKVLRYGGVTWPLAILTAVTIISITGLSRGLLTYFGFSFPLPAVLLLGPMGNLFLGAWCFHDRATRQDGEEIGWPGGLKMSALALGFFLLSALPLFGILMLFTRNDA